MASASLLLPAQHPAFNIPDYPLIWLPGRTLAEAHLEHPKEADHCIEGIVPLREAALNFLPEAVIKRDAPCLSPAKERCAELFSVPLVALLAKRLLEPAVALCGYVSGTTTFPGASNEAKGPSNGHSETGPPFRRAGTRTSRQPMIAALQTWLPPSVQKRQHACF
jgi:hypothetical protein